MAVGTMQTVALAVCLWGAGVAVAQDSATPPAAPATAQTTTAGPQGGTIHGVVGVGDPAKPGFTPLPGVAVTATNTLTGKKYATATDIDGNYAMSIPKNGRYVVRAEIIGFTATTSEVLLNGDFATMIAKQTSFGMELASRAAATEAKQSAASSTASLTRGLQGLSLSADTESESAGSAGKTGVTMPSLANINDSVMGDGAGAGADSIAVSGQSGQMNGLAGISEDDMRTRIQEGIERARANGQIPDGMDTNQMVTGVMGMMMGPGGGRGGRGGGGGGRSGGGGSGAFRNFNPAQPHGSIFWMGQNSALNATPWVTTNDTTVHFLNNPSSYSNNYGVTIGGSPYIPGVMKPNNKQFVFLNITGHRNLNATTFAATRVPTDLERAGDFTASQVNLYDPVTGAPSGTLISGNKVLAISPQADALLKYYPEPNIATTDPNANNYQTVTNAGNNTISVNTRYVRTIGGSTDNPFGGFGGGARRGGGGNRNAPPSLRQNINASYNFSHSAADNRNQFLALGGATATDGHALSAGYTIGYGRLSNNASINWNRNDSETRNYFTDTATDPNSMTGVNVPNRTGGFADPGFYNGLASFSISNFASISNQTPSKTINQTISFSDFVSYRHAKHNYRFGFDIRRVHADSIGGNNPLGSFSFTGYSTAAPADQVNSQGGQLSGSAFADFLLGLPQSTSLQAGLYKIYLRENTYDGYAQDDWRILPNVTLNYGLRYEYFAPYTEKNGRLTNLDHDAGFTTVKPVMPNDIGPISGTRFNSSLVDPDRMMFSPRLGMAWNPKFKSRLGKEVVVRAGYGINYNTGQFAQFARSLSHQSPFANTQTNSALTPTTTTPSPTPTGCTTTQSQYTFPDANGVTQTRPATTANMTMANGFGCSTAVGITNNFAVDRNYRLGMVQIYNFNLQKTIPLGIVLNVGYAGSMGHNLDVLGSPNANPATVGSTISGVAPFQFDRSLADSRGNSLVVSVQKRQSHGIALGAVYTYSHTITNASGVGGVGGTPVQDFFRLDEEYGNASFDQRHNLTGTWVSELPFGPNRAFLNKGGVWAKIFDGYSLSGSFTFGSGHYFTPQYFGNQAEASSGNVYTLRSNRDYIQSSKGPGKLLQFFNAAAFSPPASGQYGNAAPGSIEGPGTLTVNAALARTLQFGGTNSLEFRVTANNVFNTVQYSAIGTIENQRQFGTVTGATSMRVLQINARYRF